MAGYPAIDFIIIMKSILSYVLLLMVCAGVTASTAQPYKPDDPEQIIITVAQHKQLRNINSLRRQLDAQPDNVKLLDQIIKAYKSLGRYHADERYFSYAETILIPYIESGTNNEVILLHWADILQRRHQFEQSNVVLDKVLSINPNNINAHIGGALIYQVRGQYDLAIKHCRAMIGHASSLVLTICITQISSLEGNLKDSRMLLEQTIKKYPNVDPSISAWAQTALAEMYLRELNMGKAELLIRKVLTIAPRDYYALAVYADILLYQDRYQEVINLLHSYTNVDKLFLRVAIAKKSLNQLDEMTAGQLLIRISRIKQFSGNEHYRLLSRYYLDFADDPAAALKLAKKNWVNQREPEDLILLVRSMVEMGDSVGLHHFSQWVKQNKFQDKRIQMLLPSRLEGESDV